MRKKEASTIHRSDQALAGLYGLAPLALSSYHFVVPIESAWTIPEEEQVDAAARTAGELARMAEHTGGSALPDLANPTSELQKSLLDRLGDWMNSLFKPSGKALQFDLEFYLRLLMYVAIALAVIGILYLVYLFLMRARGPAANKPEALIPTLSTDALDSELERAIAAGDLARAARLRWRLFLLRNERSPAQTPYEYFKSQRSTFEEWLHKQYRIMFSGSPVVRPDYDDVDGRLTNLEAKTKAKPR